jgi:hypothetical protein
VQGARHIAFEKQGIPTVTVCTEGFLAGGRVLAASSLEEVPKRLLVD